MSTENIRASRLQLALALMADPDRRQEAQTELRRALDEPGDEPPDWRLHHDLGTLASDHATALSEFLAAVMTAPAPEVAEPVSAAMELLDGADAPELATGLDAKDVGELVEHAQLGGSHLETMKLAVRVLLLRGEVFNARTLISACDDSQIHDDPTLYMATVVSHALELIEEGSYQSALDLLTRQVPPLYRPAEATAQALALYGLGDLDEALQTLTGAVPTFDIAAARALVWLRRAAASTGNEHADVIAKADRAASEAVRLEPSSGEGLLLRAQIILEGTPNIESGRRLLIQAIRRLEAKPERAWLWRLQRRVRDDNMFRYMTFEVASACGRRDELMAMRPEQLPLSETTSLQNAALAELVGAACRDAGRLDDATAFFEAAIDFYNRADQPNRALDAQQALTLIRPTSASSLELAEKRWAAAVKAQSQGPEAVSRAIQQGLAILDGLEERALDENPGDRIQSAYLRGLLLTQATLADDSQSWKDRWVPLPWLQVAALDDAHDFYRVGHLAVALMQVTLFRPALHYAALALNLADNDRWVQEVAILSRLTWYGALDADTHRLIDGIDDIAWCDTIRAYDALLRNDLTNLQKVVGRITADGTWAHELRASALTILEGPEAAEPLWRVVLDEARERPYQHTEAINAALALHDMESARQHIELGTNDGSLSTLEARIAGAVIGVLEGEDGSLARAVEYVRTLECPYLLRQQAHKLYPSLAAAWKPQERAAVELAKLREAAIAKLDEVLSEPLPNLTVDLDNDTASSSDPSLDQVVRQLLQIEEMPAGDPAAAAHALRRLGDALGHEPIQSALAAAAELRMQGHISSL